MIDLAWIGLGAVALFLGAYRLGGVPAILVAAGVFIIGGKVVDAFLFEIRKK